MRRKKHGPCGLTGDFGCYVEAHILPRALTKPEAPGLPFIQSGNRQRPVRRWSSWTDTALVTREGEKVFERLDSWAIPVLRSHQLVWSGWGNSGALTVTHETFDSEGRGLRLIRDMDVNRMRLFLLSLLWRATASRIPEMDEVVLPEQDLEALRKIIMGQTQEPISFYPAQITQLATRGPTHNHTPISQTKTVPSFVAGMEALDIPIFRFYFDGLIVHFHRHAQDDGYTASLGNLVVGGGSDLVVLTMPYDISFQKENLERVMTESTNKFPTVIDRLSWLPKFYKG